ncbi:MAG TPA: hypothetical protein GX706_00740 [Candidatus Moranbacteria bacterium]|nr:hypothetical protein [Candidatus Moranbacteria bacterium]
MLRYLLAIPIALSFLITLYQTVSGNWLYFFLWLFVTVALALALIPVIKKDTDDRVVPVIQIFVLLFFFPIIMMIIAYFDFERLALGPGATLFYSILSGFGVLALIMILKGEK